MPCIRELPIPVATVVSLGPRARHTRRIVAELPELEIEDFREALCYAAEAVRERELLLLSHKLVNSWSTRYRRPGSPNAF